jgi:hypothetical protein
MQKCSSSLQSIVRKVTKCVFASCLSSIIIFDLAALNRAQASAYCIPGVACIGGKGLETTLKSFNIYIRNRTGRPISACVSYHRFRRSQATVDGSGTDSSARGCWDIAPGQTVFVINNAISRYAAFSATALDGSGYTWPEREVDMGGTFTRFEYTFN